MMHVSILPDNTVSNFAHYCLSCSIPESTQATATFLAKADGTLAGIAVANMVFDMVDPTLKVTWSLQGGG